MNVMKVNLLSKGNRIILTNVAFVHFCIDYHYIIIKFTGHNPF